MSTPDEFPHYSQLTFEAEGGIALVMPHIRKVHTPHPEGASGVTLGIGYDLKHRTQEAAVADLTRVGLTPELAASIAAGVGRSGAAAATWVTERHDDAATSAWACKNNHGTDTSCGCPTSTWGSCTTDSPITEQHVRELFKLTYPIYVRATRYLVEQRYGASWDALPDVVKEVLIDCRYRGDVNAAATCAVVDSKLHDDALLAAPFDYAALRAWFVDTGWWTGSTGVYSQRADDRAALLPAAAPAVTPAAPSMAFPLDVGLGHALTQANVDAYHEHTERKYAGGYYPFGANTVWHGGVHVRAAGEGEARVVACAAGTIVACRLAPTDEQATGEWGSRNFVLVRHGQGAGAWYSLYMHLSRERLDDDERMGLVPWLREPAPPLVAAPADAQGVVRDTTGEYLLTPASDAGWRQRLTLEGGAQGRFQLQAFSNRYQFSSGARRAGATLLVREALVREVEAIQAGVGAGEVRVYAVDQDGHGCQLYTREVDDKEALATQARARRDGGQRVVQRVDEAWPDGIVHVWVGPPERPLDRALLDSMAGGGLVFPGREVAAGELLWWAGEYGDVGLGGDHRAPMIHWEVFSAENLQPDWTLVASDLDRDATIDAAELTRLVAQLPSPWPWSDADEVLDAEELRRFYEGPGAAAVRTYVCRFCSEWALDTEEAVANLRGRWFTWGLKEKLDRYMWWNEALTLLAGYEAVPADRQVHHYNPIAFLAARGAFVAADEQARADAEVEGGEYHVIQPGEYLSLISARHGLSSWRAIYDHPQNAGFRVLRPDPDVVQPGDRVFVPATG